MRILTIIMTVNFIAALESIGNEQANVDADDEPYVNDNLWNAGRLNNILLNFE